MKNEKRHIREVIENDDSITIVYGKSEEWEGMKQEENDVENKQICEDGFYYDEEKQQCVKMENYSKKEDTRDINNVNNDDMKKDSNVNVFKNMPEEYERRCYEMDVETRSEEEGDNTIISGHAAMFNRTSEDLGGFIERIDKNAFDNVLEDDVRALFNHNPDLILARSPKTLSLSVDEKGLRYEFSTPNTTAGNDLVESMKRGDITQSSFGFIIEDDDWSKLEDGRTLRTIKKVGRLFDVSPVTYPAYPDSNDLTIAQRKHKYFNNTLKEKEGNKKEEQDLHNRSLIKLKAAISRNSFIV